MGYQKKDDINSFSKITTSAGGSYALLTYFGEHYAEGLSEWLGVNRDFLKLIGHAKYADKLNCALGKGAFGIVRLVMELNEDRLYAVKKVDVSEFDASSQAEEKQAVLREFDFGKILKTAEIPNVIYPIDIYEGPEKIYLFMDKVASLGDGSNVLNLLNFLDSKEQRDEIIKHTALSILESVAAMEEKEIEHGDIKAGNILFSPAGEVFLSDFGCSLANNKALIRKALPNYSTDNQYVVSARSGDAHYSSPQFFIDLISFAIKHSATTNHEPRNTISMEDAPSATGGYLRNAAAIGDSPSTVDGYLRNAIIIDESSQSSNGYLSTGAAIDEKLPTTPLYSDTWRVGITLLEMCGVVKRGEGILTRPFDSPSDPNLHGWISDYQSEGKLNSSDIASLVKKRYADEVQKIKNESMDKIPSDLHRIIFGLLEIEPENRLTAKKALEELKSTVSIKPEIIKQGFSNLVQHQITINIKNKIREEQRLEALVDVNARDQQSASVKDYGTSNRGIAPLSEHEADLETIEPNVASKTEDIKLKVLEDDLIHSADRLHQATDNYKRYAASKNKLSHKLGEELTAFSHFLFKRVKRIKQLMGINKTPSPSPRGTVDIKAIKISIERIKSILSSLTLGDLGFNSSAAIDTHNRLMKEKELLENISPLLQNEDRNEVNGLIQRIDRKLKLIDDLAYEKSNLFVSRNRLDPDQFISLQGDKARLVNDGAGKYNFYETKEMNVYPLLSGTDSYTHLIAKQTLEQAKGSNEIFIYTHDEEIAKKIVALIGGMNGLKHKKVYINDQLVSSKFGLGGRLSFFNTKKPEDSKSLRSQTAPEAPTIRK